MRKRVALAVLGVGVLAYSLVPRTVVIVPAWRVEVVDSDGRPYPNVKVVESWVHYAKRHVPEYEVRRANSAGVVVFVERTVRLTGLDELMGAARSIQRLGINASFGRSAWITVSEPASKGMGVSALRQRAARKGDELVSTVKLEGTVEQNPAIGAN